MKKSGGRAVLSHADAYQLDEVEGRLNRILQTGASVGRSKRSAVAKDQGKDGVDEKAQASAPARPGGQHAASHVERQREPEQDDLYAVRDDDGP